MSLDDIQVKLGWKNRDFEYIKDNKIDKIVIQSQRDTGFKFTVTDKRTISEMYDILSSGRQVTEKSTLEPDYVFEMYEDANSEPKYKFMYVAGLDKTEAGNLYSDDKVYVVSRRIDNDIIRNLWNLRKPREFEKVYYPSIISVLEKYGKDINTAGKVGINISEDLDVAKYILSTNLEDFKNTLNQEAGYAELVKDNKDQYDVLATMKTQGYKSDIYKARLIVNKKKDNVEQIYYIKAKYENGEWGIDVSTDKPKDW
jgi:hypothetical protein